MATVSRKLTRTFMQFFHSERSSGIVLIACTALSLFLTNTMFGPGYVAVWQAYVGGMSVEHWINDALMAVFFLLIGLELEREFYNGELSDFRNALLPIIAAAGGIAVPALIHFALNRGTDTQAGIGIPMATDIAFALGVLAILGSKIPASLKVFLTALAVIDDLGAIVVIAVFYTAELSVWYLTGAAAVFVLLVVLNRLFRIKRLAPYLIGGVLMWFLMFRSGVHATIAGVLLAFTIPFSAVEDDEGSPSHVLENFLHWPVAFIVLPVFALANTCIIIRADSMQEMFSANSSGIALGLVIGKPLGITILSFIAVAVGICRLPLDLNWKHIFGAGLLGGIGFTMSIFITNLAFAHRADIVNSSKMAVLLASLIAGILGLLFLKLFGRPESADVDRNTMDFNN
jgi:NhaA family Na+:H+ antiporter